MRSHLKKAAVLAVLVLGAVLVGCLPFPLGDPEKSTMDPKLEGYWWAQDQESQTLIAVYPYDAHTYVVHTVDSKTADGKTEVSGMGLYKGWLTMVGNARFITLEPLSQRISTADPEKKSYLVARLALEGKGMQVKGIDSDYKPFEAAKSAADITRIITEHVDEPTMYGSNPTTYAHLDPEKDKDKIEPMMRLFK